MSNSILLYAALSVSLPVLVYAFFFFTGLAPARLGDPAVYAPLLFFNAAGFALSVIVLSRSNRKPVDISNRMRLAVLLSTTALLVNTVVAEVIVHISILHKS